jgi:hypothetical protein
MVVATTLVLVSIVLAAQRQGVADAWTVAFWLVIDVVLVAVWLVRYRRA